MEEQLLETKQSLETPLMMYLNHQCNTQRHVYKPIKSAIHALYVVVPLMMRVYGPMHSDASAALKTEFPQVELMKSTLERYLDHKKKKQPIATFQVIG